MTGFDRIEASLIESKKILKKLAAKRKAMHWLAISRKKKTYKEFSTRILALEHLENNFPMTKLQADKLYQSLVVKVSHKGVIEVVACDCQDGKHADELKDSFSN